MKPNSARNCVHCGRPARLKDAITACKWGQAMVIHWWCWSKLLKAHEANNAAGRTAQTGE
jgi:hypothetical protein